MGLSTGKINLDVSLGCILWTPDLSTTPVWCRAFRAAGHEGMSGCFLARAPSCLESLFLGSFSHLPLRDVCSSLSLARSKRGARRGSGSRDGLQKEPGAYVGGW